MDRWAQVQKIFDHLADKSPSHRADYLDMVCEDDPALREEVESLLLADDQVQGAQSALNLNPFAQAPLPDNIRGYRLGDRLGEGGMGAVFAATHPQFGEVAMKLLPQFAVADPVALARFEQEAAALQRLEHPALCAVKETFVTEGYAVLVMNRVPGRSLGQLLDEDGPLPLTRSIDLLEQLCAALVVAHGKSIFHRDIKPGNIMVDERDRLCLIDFGIAKFADNQLTATGMILGTPSYMAPEQWRGDPLDGRSDLWALGVVWFEMLTGRRAYDGGEIAATGELVLAGGIPELPRACAAGEPLAAVTQILARLLAADQQERLSDCGDLLRLLDELPGR